MGEWKKTSCVLCPQNCGLEVEIAENRIGKVRGDKSNPRSQGYMCVKGANVPPHQHHADRLMHPLKKTDQGFVRISWEQAIAEISTDVRKGQVLIPHGFGLGYRGTAYGANVNYLTKNTHRDSLAAPPLHRYVPCRVERIHG